jgi:hypothetical protein
MVYNRIVRSVFVISVLIIAVACTVSAISGRKNSKGLNKAVIAPIICSEFLLALGLIWLILVLNRFRMRAAEKEDPLTIA